MKTEDDKLYGFILSARMRKMQFYAYSQQVRDNWMAALTKSCVMIDIKSKYKASVKLGQGG